MIARLQAVCMGAEARLEEAEQARVFAWRRLDREGRHWRIDEAAR